jgi:hypothetical protein
MKRTRFRMFLWRYPFLRKIWLRVVEWLAKKFWDISGAINSYYHHSTAFYFMLGVGGEENYKVAGQRLIEESGGNRYVERQREISDQRTDI